jgi:hypothetical protein
MKRDSCEQSSGRHARGAPREYPTTDDDSSVRQRRVSTPLWWPHTRTQRNGQVKGVPVNTQWRKKKIFKKKNNNSTASIFATMSGHAGVPTSPVNTLAADSLFKFTCPPSPTPANSKGQKLRSPSDPQGTSLGQFTNSGHGVRPSRSALASLAHAPLPYKHPLLEVSPASECKNTGLSLHWARLVKSAHRLLEWVSLFACSHACGLFLNLY